MKAADMQDRIGGRRLPQNVVDKVARAVETLASNVHFSPSHPAFWKAVEDLKLVNKGVHVAKSWNDNPLLVAFRTNKLIGTLDHKPVAIDYRRRASCKLSCIECETIGLKGGVHSAKTELAGRRGGKTVWSCEDCEVFLGQEQMVTFGGQTPFDVWHSQRVLPSHPFMIGATGGEADGRAGPSTATGSARKRRRSLAKEAKISTMRRLDLDDESEGESL